MALSSEIMSTALAIKTKNFEFIRPHVFLLHYILKVCINTGGGVAHGGELIERKPKEPGRGETHQDRWTLRKTRARLCWITIK
jgi:hypothetical protein